MDWIVRRLDAATVNDTRPPGNGWLWVTAGEHDCAMLRCFGWLATTFTAGEGTIPAPNVLLREFGGAELATGILSRLRGIVLMYDADDTGRLGMLKASKSFESMMLDNNIGYGDGWDGIRGIDLRESPGYSNEVGWDVSDLVVWARGAKVSAGQWLLDTAANAGVGSDAIAELVGIDLSTVGTSSSLGSVMVSMKTIEWPELLSNGITYAKFEGSRDQGSFHIGMQAMRNGWTADDLRSADAIALYKQAVDDAIPKNHEITLAQIELSMLRPFLDYRQQENLNDDVSNVLRMRHYFPFFMYHPTRKWLWWSGKHWEDGNVKIWGQVMTLSHYINEEAILQERAGNHELFVTLKKWAKASRQSARINSTMGLTSRHPVFRVSPELNEEWDSHPMMLGTPTGVFDLEHDELLLGDDARNTFCSMTTQGNIIGNIDWSLEHDGAFSRCWRKWLDLLHDWLPDRSVQAYVQEICGLALRGQLDEQIFVFKGSGRSGKSTLLDALSKALGDYAGLLSGNVIAKTGGDNPKTSAISSIESRRMFVISEVGGKTLDTDILKLLTGETTLTGRAMTKDWLPVRNTGTYFVMTNNEIDMRGDHSEAMRGRLIVVPFEKSFIEQSRLSLDEYRPDADSGLVMARDTSIKAMAKGELPGWERMPDVVLTWAYHGLMRVVEHGEPNSSQVAAIFEQTEVVWSESDVITAYFTDSGLWTRGGETVVATAGLWQNMKNWAKLSDPSFFDELGERPAVLAEMLKTRSGRGYRSVGRPGKALWKGQVAQPNSWAVPWTYIGAKAT
jgi:phage/plasmid-associated DNA primase